MIQRILHRCPRCGSHDWLGRRRCRRCGVSVVVIDRSKVAIDGVVATIGEWYDRVLAFPAGADEAAVLMAAMGVRRYRACFSGWQRLPEGLEAGRYNWRQAGCGRLELMHDALVFSQPRERQRIPFYRLTGVTIESNTLIVGVAREPAVFFRFAGGEGKCWEDALRQALDIYHAPDRITAYYPRLRFSRPLKNGASRPDPSRLGGTPVDPQSRHGVTTPSGARSAAAFRLRRGCAGQVPEAEMPDFQQPVSLDGGAPVRSGHAKTTPVRPAAVGGRERKCPVMFRLLRPVVRRLIYPRLPVVVHGGHHVPSDGAAIIVPNHGSFIDAILLGAALARPIRFMAKDSEFHHPIMAHLMSALRAFPVRRYAVDAQAVRNARRIVDDGGLLGLFPEGERSWDGRMLPLRHGALRLLLTLGVPIIPVGIAGTYVVMPRWSHRPHRRPVTIRFGSPIHLPPLVPGRHTLAVTEALERLLKARITSLISPACLRPYIAERAPDRLPRKTATWF